MRLPRHPAMATYRAAIIALVAVASSAAAADQLMFMGPAGPVRVAVTNYRDIPFRTVVRQQHDFSCGSAAVATLMTFHYGRPVAEAEVFQAMFDKGDQARIRRDGFSMLDMKDYLDAAGLAAEGFRLTVADLAELGLPVITLINVNSYKHFVVIKGMRDGRVLLGDPSFGLVTLAAADFEEIWSGIVLAVVAKDERRTGKQSFNRTADWQVRPRAPLGAAVQSSILAGWTAAIAAPAQIRPLMDISP